MFQKIGLEIASVASYLLALFGACVGMALGAMLPIPCRGACLGATLGVVLACFRLPRLDIVTPTLVVSGAFLSVK